MHEALMIIGRAIALAHDHWRRSVGRRFSWSAHIAVLQERIARLEAENALLRTRLLRMPARSRPRYRAHERLDILWHAARYRLSVTATARAFAVTRQTVILWRRALQRDRSSLLPASGRLPDLVRGLVHRLKAEWPRWGRGASPGCWPGRASRHREAACSAFSTGPGARSPTTASF